MTLRTVTDQAASIQDDELKTLLIPLEFDGENANSIVLEYEWDEDLKNAP